MSELAFLVVGTSITLVVFSQSVTAQRLLQIQVAGRRRGDGGPGTATGRSKEGQPHVLDAIAGVNLLLPQEPQSLTAELVPNGIVTVQVAQRRVAAVQLVVLDLLHEQIAFIIGLIRVAGGKPLGEIFLGHSLPVHLWENLFYKTGILLLHGADCLGHSVDPGDSIFSVQIVIEDTAFELGRLLLSPAL